MGNETKLSGSDWEKLDRKFGGIHREINELSQNMTEKVNRIKEECTDKVTESNKDLTRQINVVDTKVQVMQNGPTVVGHEKIYHSQPRDRANGKPFKFWGLVIAVVTGVSAGIGFLMALIKEFFVG